jgi:hypothetical protein
MSSYQTSFNLIIAAKVTTPRYDVSLISYLRNTFLHDSTQLKNLLLFTGILDFIPLFLLYFLIYLYHTLHPL